MTREDLADVLDRIALLLELQGENPFKIRAYKTGAEIVRSHPDDILRLARENQLDGIKGLGEALQKKLHELASTGHLVFYDELRKSFPETLFELFDLPGLGPKKVKALHDQLAITSVADVKAACEDGRIANLAGFGQKTAENLLAAIAWREQNAGSFRIGDAAPIAEQLLARLREHPDASRVEAAGSYRRGKEIIHDLDFLVATSRPAGIMDLFVGMPEVAEVLANGATKSSVRLRNGLQCDLRAVTNEEFACALAYFTGSKEHNVALRSRALARGWTLNEYRLSPKEGSDTAPPPIFPDEAALHRWLGLDFVPPELRENQGEIVAAAEGRLPRLIELENLMSSVYRPLPVMKRWSSLRSARAPMPLATIFCFPVDEAAPVTRPVLVIPRRARRRPAWTRQPRGSPSRCCGSRCSGRYCPRATPEPRARWDWRCAAGGRRPT